MNRKEAHNGTVEKWINILNGVPTSRAGKCGFCGWVKDRGGDCDKFCPLFPGVCAPDGEPSLFTTWEETRTKENAQKVLQGVLEKGIPWSEEETKENKEQSEKERKFGEGQISTDTVCSDCKKRYGAHFGLPSDPQCPYEEPRPKPRFKVGDRVMWGDGDTKFTIKEIKLVYPNVYYTSEGGTFILEELLKPAPRPKPRFKVGDKVVVKAEHKAASCIYTSVVNGCFIIDNVRWNEGRHWSYDFEGGFCGKEEWLEPAPKEEWRDVTEECTRDIVKRNTMYEGYTVQVKHNGNIICDIGTSLVDKKCGDYSNEYKIESHTDGNQGGFRILHLQGGKK